MSPLLVSSAKLRSRSITIWWDYLFKSPEIYRCGSWTAEVHSESRFRRAQNWWSYCACIKFAFNGCPDIISLFRSRCMTSLWSKYWVVLITLISLDQLYRPLSQVFDESFPYQTEITDSFRAGRLFTTQLQDMVFHHAIARQFCKDYHFPKAEIPTIHEIWWTAQGWLAPYLPTMRENVSTLPLPHHQRSAC